MSDIRSIRSISTAKPIVVPVRKSHVHHSGVNSLRGDEQWPRVRSSNGYAPVTQFFEANVCVYCERHKEDQCSVEQDQARLRNMGIICDGTDMNGMSPNQRQRKTHRKE